MIQARLRKTFPAREDSSGFSLDLEFTAAAGVTVTPLQTVDMTRRLCTVALHGSRCAPLGDAAIAARVRRRVLDHACASLALELVGVGQRALDMSVAYANERTQFGRPIGSFQAIKHKLADMYLKNELARSNAYYAAWALESGDGELPLAAAAARIGCTDAYEYASQENIQTHGGMGYTWEVDCHLYYRRSRTLALQIGSAREWKERLARALVARFYRRSRLSREYRSREKPYPCTSLRGGCLLG